jgi:hypothetical protein
MTTSVQIGMTCMAYGSIGHYTSINVSSRLGATIQLAPMVYVTCEPEFGSRYQLFSTFELFFYFVYTLIVGTIPAPCEHKMIASLIIIVP